MARGVGTSSQTDAVLLAADGNRDQIDLQILTGQETFISFGDADAVKAAGISLVISTAQARFTVTGARARSAVHMICATGETGTVGYDTI